MHNSTESPLQLRRARTLAEFLAAPEGKYFAGRLFLYFHTREHLSGFSLWGCPEVEDTFVR